MDSSQSPKNVFEQLYGKSLTPQQVAEMKFNLSGYVELLMQIDKQHKEWLRQQELTKEDNGITGGSDISPEVIN